jgi:hypothetical protein
MLARLLLLLLAVLAVAPFAAAEDQVREDLSRAKPVWYDSEHDDWRRVEVEKPKEREVPSHDGSAGAALAATAFAYLVGMVAVGVLIWLITLVFRSRTALLREQEQVEAAPLRRADISALAFTPQEGRGDPEAALAAALRAGDWRLAAIWIYTLMLLRLDRAGVVRLAPGKTNGSYRAESRRGPAAAAAALAAGIDVFERSFFGHLPVSREEIAELKRRRESLEAAVADGRPA